MRSTRCSIEKTVLFLVAALCIHLGVDCSTIKAQEEVKSTVDIVSRKVDSSLQGKDPLIKGVVYDSLFTHYPGRFQVCTVNGQGDTVCSIVDNYPNSNEPQRGAFRVSRKADHYTILVRIASGNRTLQSQPFNIDSCEVIDFKFVFGGKPIH
jgi:hypothetical protein